MLRPVLLNQGTSEVVGIKAGVSERGFRLSAFFFCWVQCSFNELTDHQLCVVNSQD